MTSYLPGIIARPITNGTDILKRRLGGLSWGPAVTVSKTVVSGIFNRLENGTLVVKDNSSGKTDTYGEHLSAEMVGFPYDSTSSYPNAVKGKTKKGTQDIKPAPRRITLTIYKDSFWVRVLLFADMGFAEAYMLGEVGTSDLAGFFQA